MTPSLADDGEIKTNVYLLSLPSRRLPVECGFSPDGLFEARFRVGNTPNLREGEQLHECEKQTPPFRAAIL